MKSFADSLMVPNSRRGLPAMLANSIRSDILRGRLNAGDKLPTEQEMSSLHGVSRVVIREAVARLRQEGLVTSRQGLGVFVASPGESNSLVLEPEGLSRPEDYRQLYELRLIMEGGAAELAARNHSEDDLDEIARCLTEIDKITDNESDYVQADLNFHKAIAAATKNTFVAIFISFVDAKLRESISLALKSLDLTETARISLREHQAILSAIRSHESAKAGGAMRRHLHNSSRRLGLSLDVSIVKT